MRTYLHCFPEAHLVCEDAVEMVVVQGDHPLQAHQLVLAQIARLEHFGLVGNLLVHGVRKVVVVVLALQRSVLGALRSTPQFRV